jgi:hypothetical protein
MTAESMSGEAQSTSSSRRAVLAAGFGGLVAFLAQALGKPATLRATNGEAVTAGNGGTLTASATTGVTTTSGAGLEGTSSDPNGAGVNGSDHDGHGVVGDSAHIAVLGKNMWVIAPDAGVGVFGNSFRAIGVAGISQEGTGVKAASYSRSALDAESTNGSAVTAKSSSATLPSISTEAAGNAAGVSGASGSGAPSAPLKTGVYGYAAQDSASRGVRGTSTSGVGVQGDATTGHGVYGQVTTGRAVRGVATAAGGVGVRADAPLTGTALQVFGKAAFSRSGRLAITAGHSSVGKTGIPLTTSSLILAVLQTNRPGIYVRAVVPNVVGSSFTIYLNAAVPGTTYVAWFVIA